MRRKLGVVGLVVLGVVMAVWLIVRSDFVAQDSCLDSGGRWTDGQCEGVRPAG